MYKPIAILFVMLAACGGAPLPQESTSELSDTNKADGQTWCHANLSLTDGVQAVFDYQVKNTQTQFVSNNDATSVWINVKSDQFHPGQTGQAVVQVYTYDVPCGEYCRDHEAMFQNQYIVNLKYENGRLTAPLPTLELSHYDEGDSDAFVGFWELAVTANGNWYKGPDGSNLRTLVGDAPGFCMQGTTF